MEEAGWTALLNRAADLENQNCLLILILERIYLSDVRNSVEAESMSRGIRVDRYVGTGQCVSRLKISKSVSRMKISVPDSLSQPHSTRPAP